MIFSEETRPYNFRRYGKPWIARLDFPASVGKPAYVFGTWLGDPGEAGELSIEIHPGDVIAIGQKDYRGRGSPNRIGVVMDTGHVDWNWTLAGARDEGREVRARLAEIAANPKPAVEIFDPCV